MKVVDFLLDTLALCGVERLFGNPGTTEIPLVRACEERGRGPSESSLARALEFSSEPRTLIDVKLDPALKPVTAARHF